MSKGYDGWQNDYFDPEPPEEEPVYCAIMEEREYQEAKRPNKQLTVGEWLVVVQAELNEAMQAWVKGDGDRDALCELVQVAACVVACLEQHGAPARV